MEKLKNSHSNFKHIIGLFIFTLLFTYFNYQDNSDHFLLSFSRALVVTTVTFYFIQVNQERRNAIFPSKFYLKQKRVALIASLFTLIQIIMTSAFDSLLYHEKIRNSFFSTPNINGRPSGNRIHDPRITYHYSFHYQF